MRQRIFLWMMVLAVAIIFSAVTAYSGTISLPKTGQGRCFDANGNSIPDCTGTGQDGEFQAGVDWPSTRFVVDATGNCVTDQLTGLMWTKNANLKPGLTWNQALDYVASLNTCGETDWRLPNVNELESLIHYDANNSANWLNNQGFTGVQAGYYWSSTSYLTYKPPAGEHYADSSWAVNISKGGTYTGAYYGAATAAGVPLKTDTTPYVWPVRGGVQ